MRHAIMLGVVVLLVATGEGLAAGNVGPPCRTVSWVGTGNMTTSRHLHAATLLPSGKVLVAGGVGFGELATAELYDPATGTWSPTGSMSVGRVEPTLTLLPTGKVLVVGGFVDCCPVASAELYDPDTGGWTTTGALLERRVQHTATLLPTGKVLVVGGQGDVAGPLASAELYDPATGEWHATGALSTGRTSHTATLLASGKVLVLGGFERFERGGAPSASAELYDPATGTWTPAAPMLVARSLHTATRLRSDAVLVAGGEVVHSSGATFAADEAELYDPATRTWRRTGSLFTPHAEHTATQLPSGKVLVVGGFDDNAVLANTELFDPESETWSDAGCTIKSRDRHTATLLRSGVVLVAGGSGGGSGDSSAELYGIIVSPGQVSLAPGARQTFTAKGGSGLGYVWSFVQNESGGTLTASGDYQAGPVGGVTDVVQVVDSFANSSTATVNVLRQAAAVSSTAPQAKSMGCGTTGGAALPSLGGGVLVLLGWTVRRRRRARATPASDQAGT
jgi:N-acetylneuraminic acid mutarotase